MRNLRHITSFVFFIVALITPIFFFIEQRDFDFKEIKELFKTDTVNFETIKTYNTTTNEFWNHNFPFSKKFYTLNAWLQYEYLQSSVKPDITITGKNGWLFYTGEDVLNNYHTSGLLSKEALAQLDKNLTDQKEFLDKLGIKFYVIFAPNKHSIYSEFLPEWVQERMDTLRIAQIIHHIKDKGIPIINLRDPILNKKRNDQLLYRKTDTHWNEVGAWIAYQEIFKRLQMDFDVLNGPEVSIKHAVTQTDTTINGGDLLKVLGIRDLYSKTIPKISFNNPTKIDDLGCEAYECYENKEGFDLSVFIYRDSFGSTLRPFFKHDFKRTMLLWDHHFNQEYIQNEKPDIVIHILAERYAHAL